MSLDEINKKNENFKIKVFDLDDYIEKGIIQSLDNGGTHLVFKYGGYVIKLKKENEFIDLESANNFLFQNSEKAEYIFNEEKNKNELLKRYFSDFKILEETQFIRIAKLGGKFYPAILKGQEYDEDFSNNKEDVLDFSSKYIEMEDIKKILSGEKIENMDNKINNIKELINSDNSFRNILINFVLSFKKFFKETGKFMDFMGTKNCIFVKDEESGEYKIKIGTIIKSNTIDTYKKSLAKLQKGEDIGEEDENNIKNGFSNIFFINSLIEELNKYKKIEKIEI